MTTAQTSTRRFKNSYGSQERQRWRVWTEHILFFCLFFLSCHSGCFTYVCRGSPVTGLHTCNPTGNIWLRWTGASSSLLLVSEGREVKRVTWIFSMQSTRLSEFWLIDTEKSALLTLCHHSARDTLEDFQILNHFKNVGDIRHETESVHSSDMSEFAVIANTLSQIKSQKKANASNSSYELTI